MFCARGVQTLTDIMTNGVAFGFIANWRSEVEKGSHPMVTLMRCCGGKRKMFVDGVRWKPL